MWPDVVNAIFELAGGFVILANIRAITRDREVKGVRWEVALFFSAWGAWNLFYYPHLDQWWSTAGAAFLLGANLVWIALALRYQRKARRVGQ